MSGEQLSLLEAARRSPVEPERVARVRERVAELVAVRPVDDCRHDRILHESKTLSRCLVCGVRMVHHRGDWRPAR